MNRPVSHGAAASPAVKVLVIDDEEAIRRNLRSGLEDLGYQVALATNGREGLELFHRTAFDLVLVDLFMPVMSGLEWIAAAKATSPHTPVIVVSGSGTLHDAVKALRLGAWDYVVKPIEHGEELDLILRRNLDRARLLVENQRQKSQLEALLAEKTHKLEASEERLRLLSDHLPDSMICQFMRKPDGATYFLHVSAGIETLNGLTAEAVLRDASLFYNQIVQEDRFTLQNARDASAKSMARINVNVRMRRADGELRWMNLRSAPRRLPDGRIVWDGIETDITERHLADVALKQSEERFSRMFQNSPIPITLIRMADGIILDANESYSRISGYTREETIGRTALELNAYPDPSRRAFIMEQVRRHGHLHGCEQQFRTKSGQIRDHVLWLEVISISGEQCMLVLGLDITEQKRAEAALANLQTELRQSQKMEAIGQLAGGIAHDFNNILSALYMQAELVATVEHLPGPAREGLREIVADVNRAAALTRQLLLFSRQQVMQMRQLNLNELIMNLGKMLQRVIREDVQLQLHLHATPLITRADAGMLEQVLMNLAVNARDAMPGGGQLHIETTEATVDGEVARSNLDATPGRYVCLSVRDTGSGIPPAVLPQIFEPFFTTKEAGKGTGLGLATVFGIVKQHQGWIKVDNRPGSGATFHVFLPASAEGAAEPAHIEVKPKPRGGTETILLVEDELAVRRLARKFLERHGYRVLEAADGVEALRYWADHRGTISLLLTDLVMPGGLNGQELGRRLLAEAPPIKVVYTSGYSANLAGQNFQLRPDEAFIQKPYAPDQLLEIIRRSLDG